MMNGELPSPPFADLMQMKAIVVEPGRVVFTCAPDDSMRNAAGAIHGGVACMVLDTVAGCVLQTTLPTGKAFASVEIKVNYLKAMVATASSTLLISDLRPE